MDSVVAIDPGRVSGWAQFSHGRLTAAGTLAFAKLIEHPPGHPIAVVIELPQVYHRAGKGDPNGLIKLAVQVGRLQEYYERSFGSAVTLVIPRRWKGTVKKEVHGRRIARALDDSERALLPKRPRAKDFDHNMLDAVGLGLWLLGRMKP